MKRKLVSILSITMTVMTLSGCSNKNVSSEVTADAKADEAVTESIEELSEAIMAETQYPIVMQHAFGETVIESKPENVVSLSWGNQDTALALGIAPVGVSAANYGKVTENTLHLWTEEAFQRLGVDSPNVFHDMDGFDFEAINDANPDVIIASYSGMTEEEYQMLSEIAPTLPYESLPYQTSWREQTILNATALGMKTEGEALVADVDQMITEKLEDYPELVGTKTAFFWISADDLSTFYVYLPTDPRAAFLYDLGLELPESVKTLTEDATDFSITVSRENANMLNDVELMVVYGDEDLLKVLQEDPLMSQIPAIASGSVVLLDSESVLAAATTPTILSIPYTIDEYLTTLSEAKNKVE